MDSALGRGWPRPGWAAVGALGVVLYVLTAAARVPRSADSVPQGVEVVVVAAGAALLLLVSRTARDVSGRVVTLTGILGVSVVVYPSLLTIALAEVAGPVVTTAGFAWHTLPLTLVQVLPVEASSRATGRSMRRWLTAIWTVAIVGLSLAGLSVAGLPGTLLVGSALFLASFVLAPTATWLAVRGSTGQSRRRAIVSALSAMFPVTLIVWCQTLGLAAVTLGWGETWLVGALFLGFALGTLLCGLHALGAVGHEESPLLRTRTVAVTLNLLLVTSTVVVGSLAALLAARADLSASLALLVGVAIAAALGVPWLRLRTWTLRVVDPAAELRHELAIESAVDGGEHRLAAQRVLRKIVEDPGLVLLFPVEPGVLIDVADQVVEGAEGGRLEAELAHREDGSPTVLARASGPDAVGRLSRLGEVGGLLERAVWEARTAHASARADRAAEDERRRVSQDLHDGLQGRLIGLALKLRVSSAAVDDPSVRLLLDETVDGIRDAVEEVRSLAGGRLPRLLVDEGLPGALTELLRPLGNVVDLDLPAARWPSHVEATAYFVVGEAVANALKHARAERIAVRVAPGLHQVVVSVADDGAGGADPRAGSGLRGLSERVSAAGGVLVVQPRNPTGTIVEAVLPCES